MPSLFALMTGSVVLAVIAENPAVRAADVIVGQSVPAAQRRSLTDIDHSGWTELLERYVDEAGFVDYAAWLKSTRDVQALDSYLSRLSAGDPQRPGSREAQLAFWINAYNAVTVRGILREYPTSSIRNHTATLFGYNIWKDLLLIVGDRRVSLDTIEHEILRPLDEPRIHFAIVCASVGCPRLAREAYTAMKLDEQLTQNAKDFFQSSHRFRVDARAREVSLSPILDWFGEDFGDSLPERLRRIAPYVPESARPMLLSEHTTVRFLDYDWSLNDQARRPSR